MQNRIPKKGRPADASRAPLPMPLDEDILGAIRRLEGRRISRPPPSPKAARPPFEDLLRDFVEGIRRKMETPPP